MLGITDANGVINVTQAQFASNTSLMAAVLSVFAGVHCLLILIQFPKQAHTFVHTISFLARL